jgi:ubiquinone/menaquinone biosynthesis C-methylase UbiE
MKNFPTEAYELQAQHHDRAHKVHSEGGDDVLGRWLDDSTSDSWRHNRMYEFAKLFTDEKGSTWLTVGDGRFGLDSVALKKQGIKNILPSDISAYSLRRAKAIGLIEDYAIENAEKMSFVDEQFDYVVCKESYHHFPRPFAALYEMLRVAEKGVIMIEPNDFWQSILGGAVFSLKKLLGRARHIDQSRYEEAGNYIYTVSEREIEKLCLGLDLPHVFFKGLNDVYVAGGECVPARWKSIEFLRMRLFIALLDCLCTLRLFKPTRLLICIFKNEPSEVLRQKFLDAGWKLVDLPRNPNRQPRVRPIES